MRLPPVCEDPLRTARGILNGAIISVVIWALGLMLAWGAAVALLGG